jgi:haloalkane dehalogenase
MDLLRTPDDRFDDLAGFPLAPRWVEVADPDGGAAIRVATYAAGPDDAPAVLMLHGEPTWSYLYRHVVDAVVGAGLRAVAVDMVGFGRSDKPAAIADHSYARHVAWTTEVVAALDLRDVVLVGQDWGGLIGLRLVAAEPERYAGVVASNTGLPTGDHDMPAVWWQFRKAVEKAQVLDVGRLVASGCVHGLADADRAAYDAPFPDETFKEGARQFPMLVPTAPDDPASESNRRAWEVLRRWDKPFLTAFSDSDPITAGGDRVLQSDIPGASGMPHTTIQGAGHFLQEDRGEELARVIVDFVGSTPGSG